MNSISRYIKNYRFNNNVSQYAFAKTMTRATIIEPMIPIVAITDFLLTEKLVRFSEIVCSYDVVDFVAVVVVVVFFIVDIAAVKEAVVVIFVISSAYGQSPPPLRRSMSKLACNNDKQSEQCRKSVFAAL